MWVVLETQFEYNDETHYGGSPGEGQPIKAFHTEERAKAHAYDLIVKWYEGKDEYETQINTVPYSVTKIEVDRAGKPTGFIARGPTPYDLAEIEEAS